MVEIILGAVVLAAVVLGPVTMWNRWRAREAEHARALERAYFDGVDVGQARRQAQLEAKYEKERSRARGLESLSEARRLALEDALAELYEASPDGISRFIVSQAQLVRARLPWED